MRLTSLISKALSKADCPGVRRVSLVRSAEGYEEQIWGLLGKRKLSLNTMLQKYSWICGLRPSQHQISICQSLPLREPIPYDKCLILTPQTIACQAPLSMGFSRQEYCRGLPCPSPVDLPNPRIKPVSLMSPAPAGGFFTTRAIWEAQALSWHIPWINIFSGHQEHRELLPIAKFSGHLIFLEHHNYRART